MKVLQINPYPPDSLGGSEIFCRNLAINLSRRKGISSDILTSDIFKKNIKQNKFKALIKIFYKRFYVNLWGVNPLVNIIPFLNHSYKNYDLIHAHSYIFLTSFQAALYRRLKKFPFILHLHGGIETPVHMGHNLWEKMQLIFKDYVYDKIIGQIIFNSADKIISVSKMDLKRIQRLYKVPRKKCIYIPNGVNTQKFRNKSNLQKKYITFIGRLSYIKGFDRFLKLAEKIYEKDKNIEFLIIGDGPLNKLLKNSTKNIPITHFPSYPYSMIEDIYNMSKCLVITSRFEGLPTTVLESLSCETPVITFDVGSISELVKPNINGFYIDIHKNN
ncbi:MAG: glycosyltransferase family 1 protein, partial [Promethearchaeota archaeon]